MTDKEYITRFFQMTVEASTQDLRTTKPLEALGTMGMGIVLVVMGAVAMVLGAWQLVFSLFAGLYGLIVKGLNKKANSRKGEHMLPFNR